MSIQLTNLFPPPADPAAPMIIPLTAGELNELHLLANSASVEVAGVTAYFCGDRLRGLLRQVVDRASQPPPPADLVRRALAAGLKQHELLELACDHFGEADERERAGVDKSDELELDDRALVSRSDDGTFVNTWTWVPAETAVDRHEAEQERLLDEADMFGTGEDDEK